MMYLIIKDHMIMKILNNKHHVVNNKYLIS